MKVRKKPVVVEAEKASKLMQLFMHDYASLPDWVVDANNKGIILFMAAKLSIADKHGIVYAELTDWVIRGTEPDDIYLCSAKVFDDIYEVISES